MPRTFLPNRLSCAALAALVASAASSCAPPEAFSAAVWAFSPIRPRPVPPAPWTIVDGCGARGSAVTRYRRSVLPLYLGGDDGVTGEADDDDEGTMSEERLGAALSGLFDMASPTVPSSAVSPGAANLAAALGDAAFDGPDPPGGVPAPYPSIDELRELEGVDRPPAEPLFTLNVDESKPLTVEELDDLVASYGGGGGGSGDDEEGAFLSEEEYLALSKGTDPLMMATGMGAGSGGTATTPTNPNPAAPQRLGGGYLDEESYARLTESLMTPNPSVPPGSYPSADDNDGGNSSVDLSNPTKPKSEPLDPEELHRLVFQDEQGYLEQSEAFRKSLSKGANEGGGNGDDGADAEEDAVALRRGAAYRKKQEGALKALERQMEDFLRDMSDRGTLPEAGAASSSSSSSAAAVVRVCDGCGAALTLPEVEHFRAAGGSRKLCRECDKERLSVRFPSQMNPPVKPFYSWDENTDDVMRRDRELDRMAGGSIGGGRERRFENGDDRRSGERSGDGGRFGKGRYRQTKRRDARRSGHRGGVGSYSADGRGVSGRRRTPPAGGTASRPPSSSLQSDGTAASSTGDRRTVRSGPRTAPQAPVAATESGPRSEQWRSPPPPLLQRPMDGPPHPAETNPPARANGKRRSAAVAGDEEASELARLKSMVSQYETQMEASQREVLRLREDVRTLEGALAEEGLGARPDGTGGLTPGQNAGVSNRERGDADVSGPWQLVEDPDTGEVFYWNEETEEMRWDL